MIPEWSQSYPKIIPTLSQSPPKHDANMIRHIYIYIYIYMYIYTLYVYIYRESIHTYTHYMSLSLWGPVTFLCAYSKGLPTHDRGCLYARRRRLRSEPACRPAHRGAPPPRAPDDSAAPEPWCPTTRREKRFSIFPGDEEMWKINFPYISRIGEHWKT